MGWVGEGGGTNNIGGASELSLAEDSTTQTERLDIARMTAVPLNCLWQEI